jgi:hypothetical protein
MVEDMKINTQISPNFSLQILLNTEREKNGWERANKRYPTLRGTNTRLQGKSLREST